MTITHPVHLMWRIAGEPEPNWQGKAKAERSAPAWRRGTCAVTGEVGDVVDGRHVVSDSFTTWDRLPFMARDFAFGRAAAWALRHRVGMQRPHLFTDTMVEATAAELHAALRALPDQPLWFVTVPVSGQKHLIPWAQPGCVQTDNQSLRWAHGDVERLGTYAALRTIGFGETAIAEPAPRWPILTKLDRADQQWTLLHWAELDPWRRNPDYLEVAARATRKEKK